MGYHLSVVKFCEPRPPMADAYHHGDLRRALLDAAAAVLATDGVGALSLRDLARRVGVSPTAPYHHFAGKADLVCALSLDALGDLDAALAAADAAHADDPRAALTAQGAAYVRFAVEHPDRFRLAFRPELGDPFAAVMPGGELKEEDATAFRQLIRRVRTLVPEAQAGATALAAWSLAHGLAALIVDGPLRALADDEAARDAMVGATLAHLAVPLGEHA